MWAESAGNGQAAAPSGAAAASRPPTCPVSQWSMRSASSRAGGADIVRADIGGRVLPHLDLRGCAERQKDEAQTDQAQGRPAPSSGRFRRPDRVCLRETSISRQQQCRKPVHGPFRFQVLRSMPVCAGDHARTYPAEGMTDPQ